MPKMSCGHISEILANSHRQKIKKNQAIKAKLKPLNSLLNLCVEIYPPLNICDCLDLTLAIVNYELCICFELIFFISNILWCIL